MAKRNFKLELECSFRKTYPVSHVNLKLTLVQGDEVTKFIYFCHL